MLLKNNSLVQVLKIAINHQSKGNLNLAEKIYNEILKQDSKNWDCFHLLGMIEYQRKNYHKSIKYFDKAIKIKPNNTDSIFSKAIVKESLGHLESSIICYKNVIKIDPNNIKAYLNLGAVYSELEKIDEALILFDKAINLDPKNYLTYYHKAFALKKIKKFSEALNCYNKVIEINPNYVEAYHNRALIYLLMGDYDKGFKEYQWRLKISEQFNYNRNFQRPIWTGSEELDEKILLISGEQGLGDNIQFIRYINLLKERGINFIIQVDQKLIKIFNRCFSNIKIFSKDEVLPNFDYYCPIMNLPIVFGTTIKNIPYPEGYLTANDKYVIKWKKIFNKENFNIGVNWQGSKSTLIDKGRSFKINLLKNISKLKNVKLYSIQKGNGIEQLNNLPDYMDIVNLGKEIDLETPFEDTAGVIKNLDLVITSDTVIAHLAGALSCNTFVALKFVPDWRWLMDTNISPWYKSLKLFRQEKTDDWANVFKKMEYDIKKLIN